MITIRDLTDRINVLSDRMGLLPAFRWGQVQAASPVTVLLDGDTAPIVGVSSLAMPVVGERVLVMVWNRRATILGASRRGVVDNTVVVDGVRYQFSGTQSVTISSWATSQHPTYGASVNMPHPFAPPAGWRFEYFTLDSGGYTLCQTGVAQSGSTRVRIVQFFSNDLTILQRVGWRLTKIS